MQSRRVGKYFKIGFLRVVSVAVCVAIFSLNAKGAAPGARLPLR